ncbi:MAG: hypothetical protein OXG85_06840 [Chloroflexi bacterium]|nr:hypothetical protein [Chloroflexota bacterium]
MRIRDFELDQLRRVWLDTAERADGFFQREVSLQENVKRGQRLGAILDATGVELAQVDADQDGLIIKLRGLPRVMAGDGIAHIRQPYHSRS